MFKENKCWSLRKDTPLVRPMINETNQAGLKTEHSFEIKASAVFVVNVGIVALSVHTS